VASDGTVSENVFQCGGSLVSQTKVLTAAHCVRDIDVASLKVRLGEYDTMLGGDREPRPHQDIPVQSIRLHENFNPGTLFNDVAIISLAFPAELTEHINPICLPSQEEITSGSYYDPSQCFASGWGKNAFDESGMFQTTLRKVDLPIVNRATCLEQLRGTRLGKYFVLHESFLCAGGSRGSDTCVGDGGGPLVCLRLGESDVYVQLGVVSWGIGCGEAPGVYASTEFLSNWLADGMRDN